MKILFTISSMGHGRGGHFYSLLSTVQALANSADVIVLNVGLQPSPVLSGLGDDRYKFVSYDGNIIRFQKEITDTVKSIKPDIIHAFDVRALFFSRNAALACKIPLAHTKCGGPNPKGFYPFVESMVLYSRENVDFFKGKSKFRDVKVNYIPNRVIKNTLDNQRTEELENKLEADGSFVFLRIARISHSYKKSILDSINLVNILCSAGVKSKLLIVGTIQDRSTYEEVRGKLGLHAHLITEDRYTVNASGLIGVADAVIGTGRGAMEAAIHGKILLAPVETWKVPALIDDRNIEHFMDFNFSERTPSTNDDEQKNIKRIMSIIQDKRKKSKLESYVSEFAADNFDVYSKSTDLLQANIEARRPRFKLFDSLFLGLQVWKTFWVARAVSKSKKENIN